MRFSVLGPLTIQHDGVTVTVPAAKQRVILASLLLRANHVASFDELTDVLWDGTPPPGARATLRNHVKRLRQAVGPAVAVRIVTRFPGYLVEVGEEELDLLRFTVLCRDGRAAADAGDWSGAAGRLGAALALWRGNPLTDVPSQTRLRNDVTRLQEVRLEALEWRIEAGLHLGRHRGVLDELQGLSAAYPLRERFHAQLMLALVRCGRQADALAVYRNARRLLIDEVGVEPGAELRHLHQRVLAGDPVLTDELAGDFWPAGFWPAGFWPAGLGPGESQPAEFQPAELDSVRSRSFPRPAQPPADLADFTGRERHTKLVCDLLSAGGNADRAGAVAIAAVAGAGGSGKTALAVHAAHELRGRFPDGQLYVNLRGSSGHPAAPTDVLGRFLRDLGLPAELIPPGAEDRATRYRSLISHRRVLVVLDDAATAAQVRPLLPASRKCAVLVTSRQRLADLEGSRPVELDVLDDADGRALFARIVGAEPVAAEPAATDAVVRACAGLPLALRIAGARLASRPGWTVATLAARLADARRRLDELAVGDLAVRTNFEVSYATLIRPAGAAPGQADPARVFRLAALVDGPSISLPVVAAAADTAPERIEPSLELLVDAHLLESPEPGRYRFHDLLRVYAAERATAEETRAGRDGAVRRSLDWYLHTADAAAGLIDPHRRRVPLDPAAPGREPISFVCRHQALSWMDTEFPNLAAAAAQAARSELDDIAWKLSLLLSFMFDLRGHFADRTDSLRAGLASARRLGDRYAEGWLLGQLASGLVDSGQPDLAGRLPAPGPDQRPCVG